MFKDLGYNLAGEVWGDASAALEIIHRKGLGKTRHLETGLLWIQQAAAEQRFKYHKVLGKEKPADLYTKFLDVATSNLHIAKLGYNYITGRVAQAHQLHMMAQSMDEYQNGGEKEHCRWVQIFMEHVGKRLSHRRHQSSTHTLNNTGGQQM